MGSGDVLIEPDLGDISAGSFERSKDAIRIGEEATRKMAASLSRYSMPPEQYAALRATAGRRAASLGTVDEIRFEGLERTNPEVLRGLVESKPGEPLTEEKIGADLRRIYGRGDFESVNYHITGDSGPRAMVITPQREALGTGLPALRPGSRTATSRATTRSTCSSSTARPGSTGWAASG